MLQGKKQAYHPIKYNEKNPAILLRNRQKKDPNTYPSFLVSPSSFTYNHENLILQLIGQGYCAQLKRTYPTRHFVLAHRVKHLTKFLDFIGSISIAITPTKAIQLFIIVILYLLTYSCKQTLLLAGFVLTTTLHVLHLLDGRKLGDFAHVQLPLQFLLAEETCKKGKYAQHD